MITEWNAPFWFTTPAGTLLLNTTDSGTGRRYQLTPGRCSANLPVRVTEDDRPQADGKISHRRWRSGYQIHLAIEPLIRDDECAGGADLIEMVDLLGLHLNAMIRTGLQYGASNARLIFTPTGQANRMFDRVQLLGAPTPSLDGELGGTVIEFDLDTPFPYYMSEAEVDTTVTETGSVTVANEGNADFWPVIELNGATSTVWMTNESVVDIAGDPFQILYNASLPGGAAIAAGDYVEITTFTGSAYLNGSGANRKAGIDMRYTDLFPIIPGDNVLTITDSSMLVKWNHAWA